MSRRAARIDRNQPEIVKALEACGVLVQSLAGVGDGVADLLILHRGQLRLLEVKDGKKPPSKRKLTPEQIDWHARWQGPHLVVVKSVDEAIAALNSKEIA